MSAAACKRLRLHALLGAALCCVCLSAARAQEAPPAALQLDFAAARDRFYQLSDQMAGAQAAVQAQHLQAQALQSLGGPIVSLNASATRYHFRTDLDLGDLRGRVQGDLQRFGQSLPAPLDVAADLRRLQQMGVQLPHIPEHLEISRKAQLHTQAIEGVWPLYTGGLITAVKRLGDAAEDEARADALGTGQALYATLVQRYFTAQLARGALQLRQQALRAMQAHDHAAERMMQEGLIARIDRLQASAALQEAQRQTLKARGDAALADMALQRSLHSTQPVVPTSALFVITEPIESLAHFEALALQNHPGLAKVAAKTAQAQQMHALSLSQYKPQVLLYGRHALQKSRGNWVAGVQASWTLYSALDRRSMAQSSQQKILQAQHADAQARSDIALLVEQNWRSLEDARQQFLATTAPLQLASELLRLRQAGLREGTSTAVELMDAQANHTRVQTQRASAANDYVQALAQLLCSAGIAEQFASYMQRADVRIAPAAPGAASEAASGANSRANCGARCKSRATSASLTPAAETAP